MWWGCPGKKGLGDRQSGEGARYIIRRYQEGGEWTWDVVENSRQVVDLVCEWLAERHQNIY